MRLKETLTTQQMIDMLNGQVVGIFTTLIKPNDAFNSLAKDLCLGYYMSRSGEKTISPAFEKIIILTEAHTITRTADEVMGDLIRTKFFDKWSRVYSVLVSEQYDALANEDHTTNKSGTNVDTDTYNSTKGKQGNNTDITTFDTNVEDDGNIATKETTTRNVNDANDVYGFNSPSPVGDSTFSESTSETVEAEADKNTSHNLRKKTGTETKSFGLDESETHTGTDSTEHVINETLTRKGRDVSGAELIEKELNLRNQQLFFDIIYADIDSVATLQIYI